MATKKSKQNNLIKSQVTKIVINPKMIVYIDEWYLEELVDIILEYPGDKYKKLIQEMVAKSNKVETFPQLTLASHRIVERNGDKFNEFKTIEDYIKETWFNDVKVSLLKVNNLKKMHVKLAPVGGVPSVPNYLNNISPNYMLAFEKEKSEKFKSATILINISGHMDWKSYSKIIRSFFRQYDFNNLSIGNISKTTERNVDYYRISVVKIRNGVNVNGQGLMFESADFLRRIMFMIYEVDPTPQVWKNYGQTLLNKDIEALKAKEPYFASILNRYLNPSIILVE
ncbi:hypothetical protein [Malacoplasma muris]|uniref:hypothetical protein n=1 Tax=Malacoplasma muris TaxID=2119 RepID=UPI00398EC5C9